MPAPLTGEAIITEFVRSMHQASMPLAYTVRVPNYYVAVLHPEDFNALIGLKAAIIEEARKRLDEELHNLNKQQKKTQEAASAGGLLNKFLSPSNARTTQPKTYQRTGNDWEIDLDQDLDNQLSQPGEFDVHVQHVEEVSGPPEVAHVPQGKATRKMQVSQQVTGQLTRRITLDESGPKAQPIQQVNEQALAIIRYNDHTGERIFEMISPRAVIGRGGVNQPVDLELYATKSVSRKHLIIQYDVDRSVFKAKDISTYGTSINGRRLTPSINEFGEDQDVWVDLPDQATIQLADTVTLNFQTRN